jgi:YaaC-like Protein
MYESTSPDLGWAALRATRWDPPPAARAKADRTRTYVFALEQAEQMFAAALNVGQATRPVLAYYGLNQAGRAVAAAASGRKDDTWRLSGHGIHAKNLTGPLADITVHADHPGGAGSFVRLSEILGSPLWPGAIELRIFWDSIPEARALPLVNDSSRRTPLYVDLESMHGEAHPLATAPIVDFPPWVLDSADRRRALDEYLVVFPGAANFHSYVREGRGTDFQPRFSRHRDGWGELRVNWMVAGEDEACTPAEQEAFLRSITRKYNGGQYFFPTVTGSDQGMHPLMAWWVVLYSLSMLARYQPAEWSTQIDVDHSRYAVALETLLKDAMVIVPVLIAETIEQVS